MLCEKINRAASTTQ